MSKQTPQFHISLYGLSIYQEGHPKELDNFKMSPPKFTCGSHLTRLELRTRYGLFWKGRLGQWIWLCGEKGLPQNLRSRLAFSWGPLHEKARRSSQWPLRWQRSRVIGNGLFIHGKHGNIIGNVVPFATGALRADWLGTCWAKKTIAFLHFIKYDMTNHPHLDLWLGKPLFGIIWNYHTSSKPYPLYDLVHPYLKWFGTNEAIPT